MCQKRVFSLFTVCPFENHYDMRHFEFHICNLREKPIRIISFAYPRICVSQCIPLSRILSCERQCNIQVHSNLDYKDRLRMASQ